MVFFPSRPVPIRRRRIRGRKERREREKMSRSRKLLRGHLRNPEVRRLLPRNQRGQETGRIKRRSSLEWREVLLNRRTR